MAHLLLSAAHKSSGKTTLTLGLCAAFTRRGLGVQPFKKGPDYIDPMWLGLACGRACHNLDFYTQEHDEILSSFHTYHASADISLIEGNKGLHDGVDLEGSNSSAALAKLLHAPVVLVIDTQGMTRGVAPLLLGFQQFDPQVQIAGVILNKVGGKRHEGKLRDVVERYTDIPVLGAVQRDPALQIVERHLGLMPSNESQEARAIIERIADRIEAQVDMDALLTFAQGALTPTGNAITQEKPTTPADIRVGILRDAAFGFYYPGDLAALRHAGAKLIEIDALHDKHLPNIDGLFIGGGFPEVHMQQLQTNTSLREEIRRAIDNGLPAYAECGGLMYLAKSIQWLDQQCDMVGIIDADVVMHERPIGRGYTCLKETPTAPWPSTGTNTQTELLHAHEFHYSSLEHLDPATPFAYQVERGMGIIDKRDGIVYKNLLATYAHQRDVRANPWTARFTAFIRHCKQTGAVLTQTH